MRTHQICHPACNQGCDGTRDECRIFHDSNADDLHRKDRRSQRCPKQGGKRRAHTAHDHDLLVVLIKLQPFSDRTAKASAELQSCTFSSGRSTKRMRQNRRYNDQRRHPKRDVGTGLNALKHQVCIALVRIEPVQCHDHQPGQRQKIKHPAVRLPKSRHLCNAPPKQSGDQPQNDAAAPGQQKPARQNIDSSHTFHCIFFHNFSSSL